MWNNRQAITIRTLKITKERVGWNLKSKVEVLRELLKVLVEGEVGGWEGKERGMSWEKRKDEYQG